jgi:hypothetical protein
MTREPVVKNGKVVGHNVTTEPVYIRVRDDRGYESIIQIHPRETRFEPAARQRSLLGEE